MRDKDVTILTNKMRLSALLKLEEERGMLFVLWDSSGGSRTAGESMRPPSGGENCCRRIAAERR